MLPRELLDTKWSCSGGLQVRTLLLIQYRHSAIGE